MYLIWAWGTSGWVLLYQFDVKFHSDIAEVRIRIIEDGETTDFWNWDLGVSVRDVGQYQLEAGIFVSYVLLEAGKTYKYCVHTRDTSWNWSTS